MITTYAFDYARIVTPVEFKKSCQQFHRENRADLGLTLSQLQQHLARSIGFRDLQGLQQNEQIVIEYSSMMRSLGSYLEVGSFYKSFFFSDYLNTGRDTLMLAISGLGETDSYVDPIPYTDDGRGLYREGTDFIALATDVALSVEDWKRFVTDVQVILDSSELTETEELLNEISWRFDQIESVQPYSDAYSYAGDYPEFDEAVFSLKNKTKGSLRQVLSEWYLVENDFYVPLSEVIERYEEELGLS
jgi:hypothetical protein